MIFPVSRCIFFLLSMFWAESEKLFVSHIFLRTGIIELYINLKINTLLI